MPFQDRTDAGRQLAEALSKYKSRRPVILALPRGGVPVAAEVARALDAPLDLLLARKIGVPSEPELAMGAAPDGGEPTIVRNDDQVPLATRAPSTRDLTRPSGNPEGVPLASVVRALPGLRRWYWRDCRPPRRARRALPLR